MKNDLSNGQEFGVGGWGLEFEFTIYEVQFMIGVVLQGTIYEVQFTRYDLRGRIYD